MVVPAINQGKETCTNESFMKTVRIVELYVFEDIKPSFHDVTSTTIRSMILTSA